MPYTGRTLSKKQSQPELLGLEVLEPATLALSVSLEDLIARSYGVQGCASALIFRATSDLRILRVNSLSNDRFSMDVLALAEEAIGRVRVRLRHIDVSFVFVFTNSASRGADCGEWSFSVAT